MSEDQGDPSALPKERLLPQASIRFFMILIGVCAFGMYTLRTAIVQDQLWAKIASLVIATIIGCYVVYAILFFLANVFTATTAPLAKSVGAQPDAGPGTDDSPSQ